MSSPIGAPVPDHGPDRAAGRSETLEQEIAAALPADWALIGRCRTGDGTTGDRTTGDHARDEGGCFVLAHAAVGVALVDLACRTTPDAELRLRRLLNLVDFAAVHRGYLPIVHCRVGAKGLGGLMRRLDAAFAYEPQLAIRRRTTWVAALRRVLRASGTWEAIGQPLPISWGEVEDGMRQRSDRTLAPRGALVAVVLLATFGAGLASGLLWAPPAGRAGTQVEASGGSGMAQTATPSTASPEAASPMAATPSAATDTARDTVWKADGAAGPGVRALPGAGPAPPLRFELPAPALQVPMPPVPMLQSPVFPAPVLPVVAPSLLSASAGGLAVAEVADAGAGLNGAVPQSVPPPVTVEAVAGAAPARRPREPLPIDRRCSDAVFRYQQGASLSADEMGYVRRGCASWR